MSKAELIQRAIESAKCRIYKLGFDEQGNLSAHHQKKVENQKEIMNVTIEALENYLKRNQKIDEIVDRLEDLRAKPAETVYDTILIGSIIEMVKEVGKV